MRKNGDIKRYSAKQLAAMKRKGKGRTDWARLEAMSEPELRAAIAADPDDVHVETDWTRAVAGLPPRKRGIHIRLDEDVLTWFRKMGKGYQTMINNVLRAFVESRSQTGSHSHLGNGKTRRAARRQGAAHRAIS